MRKKYSFWEYNRKHQQGFIFPFLLFLTALLLIAISYHIKNYQTIIEISRYHEENVILDSLYQMAGEELKSDLPTVELENASAQLIYNYPSGKVIIDLNQMDNQIIGARFFMETSAGKSSTKTIFFKRDN